MKTTNLSIATVDKKLVPKPTKYELLRATAEALAREHNKAATIHNEKRSGLVRELNATLKELAERRIDKAEFSASSWNGKTYEVKFVVSIPFESVAVKRKAAESMPAMKLKTWEDFMIELKQAIEDNDDRVERLLKDKSIHAKLLEAGRSMLRLRLKHNSVEV